MANAIANTLTAGDSPSQRESLSSVADRLNPEDTLLYSMAKKTTADSKKEVWFEEDLTQPGFGGSGGDVSQTTHEDFAEGYKEGREYEYSKIDPVIEVGNFTQIFQRPVILSHSINEAKQGASADLTVKRKTLQATLLLKKDVEYRILLGEGGNPESSADPSRMAGLPAYVKTNAKRGAGAVDGGYIRDFNRVVGETFATAATTVTLDIFNSIDEVYSSIEAHGYSTRRLVMAPGMKRMLQSGAETTTVGLNTSNIKDMKTVDVWFTPNGRFYVFPHRLMGMDDKVGRRILFVNPEGLEFMWLRKIMSVKNLGHTSDAVPIVVQGEGCVAVKQEISMGAICDLNTSGALNKDMTKFLPVVLKRLPSDLYVHPSESVFSPFVRNLFEAPSGYGIAPDPDATPKVAGTDVGTLAAASADTDFFTVAVDSKGPNRRAKVTGVKLSPDGPVILTLTFTDKNGKIAHTGLGVHVIQKPTIENQGNVSITAWQHTTLDLTLTNTASYFDNMEIIEDLASTRFDVLIPLQLHSTNKTTEQEFKVTLLGKTPGTRNNAKIGVRTAAGVEVSDTFNVTVTDPFTATNDTATGSVEAKRPKTAKTLGKVKIGNTIWSTALEKVYVTVTSDDKDVIQVLGPATVARGTAGDRTNNRILVQAPLWYKKAGGANVTVRVHHRDFPDPIDSTIAYTIS